MRLSVGETAKRMGISVRTLHYYDQIGLLAPSAISEAGYRFYDDAALERLQQILFFRELELSLDEIRAMLENPHYDKRATLENHRSLLMLKRRRLDELITLVEATIGGKTMKQPETTPEMIRKAKEGYAREARERWGNTEAYQESEKRHATYSDEKENVIAREADEIFAAFAAIRKSDPAGSEAQALVARWQAHISAYHYPCTREILAGLGEMYTGDARFMANIDRFGEGTAQFMHDAINVFCM